MLTTQDLLDYLYYRCLPLVYRDEDAAIKYVDKDGNEYTKPLYRYLQALLFGGYEPTLKDIENLLFLVDPENCPAEFFPSLYESFGLEYYPDIDISYHRKFLANYGELVRRRGTYSSIAFLTRVLTGLEVSQSYLRGEYLGEYGRHLILTLKATSIMDIINLDTSVYVIKRFLSLQFVPYYITVQIATEIAPQDISTGYYHAQAVNTIYHYNVFPTPKSGDIYSDVVTGGTIAPRIDYTIRPLTKQISVINDRSQGAAIVTGIEYEVKPDLHIQDVVLPDTLNAGAITSRSVYNVAKGE